MGESSSIACEIRFGFSQDSGAPVELRCFRFVDFVSVGINFVNFSLCALVILVCCHVFAIFGLAGSVWYA